MTDEIEITDRYQALGIPRPNPETMCQGDCEGTGWYPVYDQRGDTREGGSNVYPRNDNTEAETAAWDAAEAEHPADDGWHFIKCPDCNGTGLKQ